MKKSIFVIAMLLILGSFSACKKAEQCEKIEIYPIANNPQATLVNTNWKFVGFVDVAKECLKRPEPIDCKIWNCEIQRYSLAFKDTISEETSWVFEGEDADMDCYSIFFGYTSTNSIICAYHADYETGNFQICNGVQTLVGETDEGYLYSNALSAVRFFSLKDKELRLYYNNKQNYLLFKSQEL